MAKRVSGGASLRDAFLLSGIAESTGHHWLSAGQRDAKEGKDSMQRQFLEAVEGAKAQRRVTWKELIHRAAEGTKRKPGDWRAAAALGAITDPEEFVPKVRVFVTSEFDAALDRLELEFSDEPLILERALRAISGASGGGVVTDGGAGADSGTELREGTPAPSG